MRVGASAPKVNTAPSQRSEFPRLRTRHSATAPALDARRPGKFARFCDGFPGGPVYSPTMPCSAMNHTLRALLLTFAAMLISGAVDSSGPLIKLLADTSNQGFCCDRPMVPKALHGKTCRANESACVSADRVQQDDGIRIVTHEGRDAPQARFMPVRLVICRAPYCPLTRVPSKPLRLGCAW